MSNPPSFTLNAINAQGLGLRVVFEWRGDRYGHTIYSVDGNESTPLCASVEGTPTDFWPASPPVQEIVEHELPGGQRTLLLTGQSGKSHWSATVEAAGACLCFDIAVRLKEPPQRLGSTYEALAQENSSASFQPSSDPASATTVEQLADSAQQSIVPPLPSQLSHPTTIRWKYRVKVLSFVSKPRL